MNRKVTVILVDDHAVVRAGFKMLLANADFIEVIAEAERGEQACQLFTEHQPDLMVLDLSMPGIGGLETIRRICQRYPEARILVYSIHDEAVYVNRALTAGAKGYITKSTAPAILAEAISTIADGGMYIEDGLLKTAPAGGFKAVDFQESVAGLSAREFDIFLMLAKGLTAHKISEELCLGYKTIANYGTQIRAKLQVSSIAELTHIAISLGLINAPRQD